MKIALIGCGHWGKFILRDLVSLGCSVDVVARSKESRERAEEGKAASVRTSIGELPSVDGVVVATATSTHVAVLDQVLSMTKAPVYVEKPIGMSGASVMGLSKKAKGRLFVMDKWRYHPGVLALAGIAKSGELGRVLGLRTWRTAWGGHHSDTDAAWHLMPHDLSIALEILGEIPKPRAAVAEVVDGTVVSMTSMLGGRPWLVSEVSERSDDPRRRVTVFCERGLATLGASSADHISVSHGSEKATHPRAIGDEMPLLEELRAFVGHLNGGPPPKSSFEEGLEAVRAIEKLAALAKQAKQAKPGSAANA